jgi:hyperosmotically inducible protein
MLKYSLRGLAIASALILGLQASAQSADDASVHSISADNTTNNRVDPSNGTDTADAQKNDAADARLTQQIRQRVMADKSLSSYAHNVKIVTINGTVTLNGVVRSEQEKSSIEMKAASAAGKERVIDELKIASR